MLITETESISASIYEATYKSKPYFQASLRYERNRGLVSYNRSFDTESEARRWLLDKVEDLMLTSDSILSAPTCEACSRRPDTSKCIRHR